MPTPDDASDRELADAALAARLLAALAPTGAVTCRRLGTLRAMFHPASGADAPFGFVLRAEAYFKAGPDTVTKFIARGMSPYRPADVRQPLRGYWRVPPDVLGDEQRLMQWAQWAVDAARQFGKRGSRRGPRAGVTLRRQRPRAATLTPPPGRAKGDSPKSDSPKGDAPSETSRSR